MRSAEAPEDARVRVLIAEDHALVRDGIRELLERQSDIEVVGEAADGEEAVQLARQLQPDIVLMDISMPRLNGVEATRIIKQSSPHIAVLVLSAYDDDAYVFAVFEAGAAGYLLKSAKSIEVVDAVRAVWQGDSPLHPSIARKVLRRFQPGSGHPAREALYPRAGIAAPGSLRDAQPPDCDASCDERSHRPESPEPYLYQARCGLSYRGRHHRPA